MLVANDQHKYTLSCHFTNICASESVENIRALAEQEVLGSKQIRRYITSSNKKLVCGGKKSEEK